MSNILIAYFSRAGENYMPGGIRSIPVGNTELAAKKLAALTGGELFKIEAAKDYPEGYSDCVEVSRTELARNARPELKALPMSIEGFDKIILCYPCWCGTMPMPVFTFLEKLKFSGKAIYPLCTNEGSGMGSSERDIQQLCPAAEVKNGLSVKGSRAEETDYTGWLKNII